MREEVERSRGQMYVYCRVGRETGTPERIHARDWRSLSYAGDTPFTEVMFRDWTEIGFAISLFSSFWNKTRTYRNSIKPVNLWAPHSDACHGQRQFLAVDLRAPAHSQQPDRPLTHSPDPPAGGLLLDHEPAMQAKEAGGRQ